MICPDFVRSRVTAPGNHRHGNPPCALHPGGASLCAGQPVPCRTRAGSNHLLRNTRCEEALSWCKPARRGAATCTHEKHKIGLFPGLREAPAELSWGGGMVGARGLVKSSAVQNTVVLGTVLRTPPPACQPCCVAAPWGSLMLRVPCPQGCVFPWILCYLGT